MAEEQFTSRRARREAERLAAEQEFEARSTPAQPTETNRADLLTPPQRPTEKPKAPAEAAAPSATSAPGDLPAAPSAPAPAPSGPSQGASAPSAPAPQAPAAPAPTPENAEHNESAAVKNDGAADKGDAAPASRIDPAPAERISHERGALASDHLPQERPPVNAEDRLDPRRAPLPHFESRAARKRYLKEHGLSLDGDLSTGAIPVIATPEETAAADAESADAETVAAPREHESFDTAGFGGTSDEVAARDFESPVTADSAPRPASGDDALSRPAETAPAGYTVAKPAEATEKPSSDDALTLPAAPATEEKAADTGRQAEPSTRSRRMPIVQPPTTSGVRVVTAASAQVTETPKSTEVTEVVATETTPVPPTARREERTDDDRASDAADSAQTADEAARALAANPETRPMDAVPEAWALPNPDYEDEETENPPGTRIKASAVTGYDGQILVGEEPSKVSFVVLGIAALFAIALIVIALVMLL
ncbi:hypothetical protein [Brevibacterium metallidurans]|uniref:Uncharacterized protein n=1 Tax=Brevibacterium metallidurans TaxID=1482676 RepID=A0ABN0SKS7_9MICO